MFDQIQNPATGTDTENVFAPIGPMTKSELRKQLGATRGELVNTRVALENADRQVTQQADEVTKLKRLLGDAVRMIFLAGPALKRIIGEPLLPPVPTSTHEGVICSSTMVNVTLIPSTETIVVEGIGTLHRLELVTNGGRLDTYQIERIVALVAAIRAVKSGQVDPLTESVNLLGEVVEPGRQNNTPA